MSSFDLTPQLSSRLDELEAQFKELLEGKDADFLTRYPMAPYVERIEAFQVQRTYDEFPEAVLAQCREIEQAYGTETLGVWHKLLLVKLMRELRDRSARQAIPPSVQPLVLEEFGRICSDLGRNHPNGYRLQNWYFLNDLGYCRLRLIPCGSEFVETWSGVARRTLFRGGIMQFCKGAAMFAGNLQLFGRLQPYYEMHWDRRLARLFNENDYNECYLRIADLLQANPQMRGLITTSWWFDPKAIALSPELGFLRRVPEENGARIFKVGERHIALIHALMFSSERKAAYDEGSYLPLRYMVVWPRREILAWARRFRPRALAA